MPVISPVCFAGASSGLTPRVAETEPLPERGTVGTLCAAAARSQVDVCFEGVEDEQTVEYLKGYGDVLLQGYYFDKPLLTEDFMAKYCEKSEV